MIKRSGFAAALLCLACSSASAATYTLTVEPNYPPNQAQDVYRPLLDYLGRSTGHTFKLRVAANYHVHWRNIRDAAGTDFAFEEAHFADYRIERHGFTPLVRVAEPSRWSLLAGDGNASDGARGLIGYRIVSMPSPSLGYLVLSELYPNPISQPEIQSVAASWRDGVEMVFSAETEAAMVPSYIAQLYPNVTPVFESREFPGRALSAAGNVPTDVREAVTEAMLKLHEDGSAHEVLVELGTAQFVPAQVSEYAGHESLLRYVFGYQAKARPAEEIPDPSSGIQVSADRGN
ncbi:MAG TPA: PhnD/SsuA/transferrin family substrate-binding protein [Arenimonas sp.]|nr:PhnD/SsuA/transferrin family substrate-binding protein [Arenimonas sp.]